MIITTVHFMILHMNKVALMDGDGPTTCTSSSGPESSNIYDVVVVATSESGVVSASGGAAAFVISSTINSEISHTTSFKSPEVGMAASLEFPFTSAQWKELERQALVYKYMMASLPVPLDLLYPDIRSPSAPAASHCPLGSSLNLRFSGRGDFEPGRCRRTDGKKWRCSRDVAPDQKYCERHMHRGRPRSRKPVELPKKKTRHSHTQDLPSSPSTIVLPNSCSSTITITSDSPSPFRSPFHHNDATESPDELNQKAATFGSLGSVTSFKEPRGLEWLIGKESVSVASDQDWQHLIRQTKIELPSTSPVLNQNYSQETLNFNSYVDFWKDQEINNCPFFLNPNITPLEKPQENPGRSFIDAWSSDDHNANPYSKTNERVSLSSLSLSMGGSSIVDNEMGHIHMGAGVIDPDQNQEYGAKSLLSNWLPPASWTAPTPGGPLGEVLRPSKVAHAADATTIETNSNSFPPGSTKGDPCSPSVNAMSSPSGVFLHSSSNPTFTNSGAKPEIGLLWLSQAKPASST